MQSDFYKKNTWERLLLRDKIMLAVIALLVLVILIGTLFSMLNERRNTPEVLLSKGKAVSLAPPVDDEKTAYFELGTMRIVNANENTNENTVLVASAWLAYPADDTVFYEEIARKRGVVRGIMQKYFSERTKNQLLSETEEVIEKKLVQQINSRFSLGKISGIYFTDYIFLE